MKVLMTFKTPEIIKQTCEDMTDEEKEIFVELAEVYVENDEYLNIEFDTDDQTVTVLRARR